MPDYSKFYDARDIIADILQKDLIGPVENDEILSEFPAQYYIMGKLYPQGESEDVIDLVRNPYLESEIESYDASVSLSNQKNPSSLGLTCTLKPDVSEIRLSGSYAFYDRFVPDDERAEMSDNRESGRSGRKQTVFWKRRQYEFCENIHLGKEKRVEGPVSLENGMQLQVYTHAILDTGERIITVVIINVNSTGGIDVEEVNRLCAFQVELILSSSQNECIFADSDRQEQFTADPELMELQMLYSDIRCYGQGHGCSVEWDQEHPEPQWVSSSWLPSFNLRQMMAAEISDKTVLQMNLLAHAEPESVVDLLREFVDSYREWIDDQSGQINTLKDEYRSSAEANMEKCREAYRRMDHSIDLLEDSIGTDGKAIRAFQLANEAMLMQRRQTILKNDCTFNIDEVTWYPFQLAFILHELSSFINPDESARNVVDLLWFPTGGGKTEAYLGITAFVIFLRRIRDPQDDGVTAIMRYTLRLLTLQQFERASIMICACELLRQKYRLGGNEISIGLWVGGKLTPNTLKESRSYIRKQQMGAMLLPNEPNPCQIQVCPWCGSRLTAADYEVKMNQSRMILRCPNEECDFHAAENGLPIHIIDDAVYKYLPTFLIATVDKFAQIPWNEKPASLFGISSHKNPPELIIQDELHLISGPLGTVTGIYEAAVTELCKRNGRGAKIIASTATIRNAGNQIRQLYGKNFTQFPPQGITAGNSYFAVESTTKDKPARKYFGVMGTGTTMTTTLVRVNAALLFATRYLAAAGFEDQVVDNFWTITGYFNSLRELGGASTQILDDVQSRFSYLAKTKFALMTPKVDTSEHYDYFEELTSRMDNTEISRVIQDKLKRSYSSKDPRYAYDFVLASNMISVGVDVGRLGTMVVAGQPKTNAEYIQATSRVGRDNPGIVITVYNPTRSRDRSHYEQFLKYHSALYRYVEATSLTPFADRARDRGLHALYVALYRYLVPGMLENEHAVNFRADRPENGEIAGIIYDYVKTVDPDELEATMEELQDIEDQWDMMASGQLAYRGGRDSKSLLKSDTEDSRFRTMNSMRSVDAQAGIYLLGR